MNLYQYKWAPVTQSNLLINVGPGIILISINENLVTISAQPNQKDDLDAYMNSIGFQYVGEII